MNAVGYDAMVVGNHEFNFGLKNLSWLARTRSFPGFRRTFALAARRARSLPTL